MALKKRKKLLIGTRKGLVVYEKSKSGWTFAGDHFLAAPVSIAASDPHTGDWWAMLDHGHWGSKLHRSSNQGKIWEELTVPKYPEGEKIKNRDGSEIDAVLKYMWAFASDGKTIYIGTEPGGLFTSSNNGKSFKLNRGLWEHPSRKDRWFGGGRDFPGIHSVVIDPLDAKHLYIGISCAGVFESLDGGKTWLVRNKGLRADFMPDPFAEFSHDPHLLVACPSEPEKLWQQNHCGVFRSVDGGKNWTDVSEKSTGAKKGSAQFGFAVAVDEKDGDVAWVIPGIKDELRVPIDKALCVCRTDNGGKTWKKFTKGLPQKAAYDMVYRHALALSGDTLAFGTTSGNLYISENRGESWECLNNNLALVYSCNFV